jgi:hypothetical protein
MAWAERGTRLSSFLRKWRQGRIGFPQNSQLRHPAECREGVGNWPRDYPLGLGPGRVRRFRLKPTPPLRETVAGPCAAIRGFAAKLGVRAHLAHELIQHTNRSHGCTPSGFGVNTLRKRDHGVLVQGDPGLGLQETPPPNFGTQARPPASRARQPTVSNRRPPK